MKKQVVALVAGVVSVAALSGALVALKVLDKPDDSSVSSTDSVSGTMLWHHESEEVKTIEVTYQGEAYTITRLAETEQDEEGNEIINYTIKGWEDLPINKPLIRTTANRSAAFTTEKTVEEDAADLAKYGLEKPQSVVKATLDDGTALTFSIGDVAPIANQQYILVDGTVYTASTTNLAAFVAPAENLLATQLTEELAEDDKTLVEKLTVQRKDTAKDLILEYDHFYAEMENGGTTACHVMTSPIACNVNVEKSTPITHGLFGLAAQKAVTAHPTETDLKTAGLDDPFCTVTMALSDNTTRVLKLGNSFQTEDDKTYYYGYYEGIDVIYTFDSETAAWATVTPTDIAAKLVFVTYVWDIGKLTVEADGKEKMVFEGKGKDGDDYVCTLNGEAIEAERYRQFYVFLLKTAGEDLCLNGETPTGKKIADITLERQDGLKTQRVQFYEADGLQCYIVLDGVCTFKCRKSYVDTLLKNIDRIRTSEDFVLTW